MYQVGISSREQTPIPVCPVADQISEESAAFLNREDSIVTDSIDIEDDIFAEKKFALPAVSINPNYAKIAACFAVIACAGYFMLPKGVEESSPVVAEIEYPKEKRVVSIFDKDQDLGVDTMTTGSIPDFAIPKPVEVQKIHLVKGGETLSHIALKYKTTVAKIVEHNGIKDPARLKLNARLVIR